MLPRGELWYLVFFFFISVCYVTLTSVSPAADVTEQLAEQTHTGIIRHRWPLSDNCGREPVETLQSRSLRLRGDEDERQAWAQPQTEQLILFMQRRLRLNLCVSCNKLYVYLTYVWYRCYFYEVALLRAAAAAVGMWIAKFQSKISDLQFGMNCEKRLEKVPKWLWKCQ